MHLANRPLPWSFLHMSQMHAKCDSIEASMHLVASLGREGLAFMLPFTLWVCMHVQLPS